MAGQRAGGTAPAPVDQSQLLSFRQDGWFVVEEVFSPGECDRIVDELETTGFDLPLGEAIDGPISYRPMGHASNEALREVATDPRWAHFVFSLVGPDARLYWEQGVAKAPGALTELPWHQDNGYTPLVPQEYLSCWLALDDASTDNGCLWVLPGSHRGGTLRHHGDGKGPFRIGYDGDECGVPVPAQKGSVVVFSSLLLHRSGPNTSGRHRRAWIIQFCPAAAVSALSGRVLDDRLRVASGGTWLDEPFSERPFDLLRVLGNYDRR